MVVNRLDSGNPLRVDTRPLVVGEVVMTLKQLLEGDVWKHAVHEPSLEEAPQV